ncbi:endonuclease/exonuclease/phosphatase family protein [Clostridium boliviensis]|uniref:Endonuclease/exonuclease/phosphatase family protein n=1 Tax=Clostridium boliviensis TaxID=318465 RepID=A0ABU4GQ56_9CLOT|nr:endonuclease/exonuclease/phosphatase family protein [Clostridium boliviensis]MDW2799125.1 endonuclease/exonuclease/phosphatase family protein [Clostridium boliviensis]
MKVVTFNIRCDYEQDEENSFCYRKPYILQKIVKESPDIICFQEVLPHVALWLKENLTDYNVVGCGRGKDLNDEQTAVAYRKVKFDLLGFLVFWLSKTPGVFGSRYENQSICPRTCTKVFLWSFEDKRLIRIYNTHLDHESKDARKSALRQILKTVRDDRCSYDAPAVIAGDFNACPDSPEMKVMNAAGEFVDLTGGTDGTFHDYGRQKAEKIDYIYGDSVLICQEVTIWDESWKGVYLSDHYPVCVRLKFAAEDKGES